jgi:hypothetical protein
MNSCTEPDFDRGIFDLVRKDQPMQGGENQRMSSLVGKAGEHAVACQLMLRGLDVGFLGVGVGTDLVAENGCRIQVKSGHLCNSDKRGSAHYMILLRKTVAYRRRSTVDSEPKVLYRKPFSEMCDVVVFWGIEQNRFWVVPSKLCDDCYAVRLGMDLVTRPRFVENIADVRSMVDLGYSHSQIATHYGTTRAIIQRFLAGGKDCDESVTAQMRACENDWGKILDFTRTSTEKSVEVQEEKP